MRRLCALLLLALLCPILHPLASAQQNGIPAPTLQLQGLRSQNQRGSFNAGVTLPDGSLVLLYDQGDGLRLLKTDPAAGTVLAQTQQGAAEDRGLSLTTDGLGNLYVAGTSASGLLQGTSGTAYPAPADTTTTSFVARFDRDLNLVFLTFLGAGKTEVNDVVATADAVFVTGVTYSGSFRATTGAFQSQPPNGEQGNAFVQRFSTDGTALVYSTFLDAPGGTVPSALAVDAADTVVVAGATSAPGFPTKNALQPVMLGSSSGFVSKLFADGTNLVFSTFLAGSGIASLAPDPATGTLLLSGNVAPGQFPVAKVTAPLANIPYQSVLRLSSDGQTLLDSVLLLPGDESYVQPSPDGTLWVTGKLGLPLPPATADGPGDAYALHLTKADVVDQLLRLGGEATNNPAYASLTTEITPPVLSSKSPDGLTVFVPGTVSTHTAASLRPGQSFDLALNAGSSSVVPSTVRDMLPPSCTEAQDCSGSGGMLTAMSLAGSHPFLTVSTGDGPSLILRNTGPAPASALTISPAGFADNADCPQSLPPFAQCAIALSGGSPGTLDITSSNASPVSISLPAASASAEPLAFDASELDFGIVTASASATRTVTVTNLGTAPQTFASAAANLPTNAPYTLAETNDGTCAGSASAHTLPAGGSCSIVLRLTASSLAQNDGPVRANWQIGTRTLAITGYTQAASLSLSATEIDFGPQPTGSSPRLPRYLYLSNNSGSILAHSPLALPPNSPFTLLDGCPSLLAAGSVCQISFTYSQPNAPALDSVTIQLDQGLSVLVTGETLQPAAAAFSLPPSPLLVAPLNVVFSSPVPVSGVSNEPHPIQVTNPTALPVALSVSVLGDFAVGNQCGSTLPPVSTCTLDLAFTPAQPGTRAGLLSLSTGAGTQTVQVSLSGVGTQILPATNGTLDLGQTVVGEPTVSWFQLQGTFPQLAAAVSGPGMALALLPDDGSGHGTLPDSAFTSAASAQCTNCWLALRNLPAEAGVASGALRLTTSIGGDPYQISLQAIAVPAEGLVLTPALQDFGVVGVGGRSAPVTFTLTNLLPNAATASVQQVNASGDFNLAPSAAPPSCNGTLSANAACSVLVSFAPSSTGRRTGALQIVTSAGTVTAALTGTGISGASASSTPENPPQPSLAVFPAQADFGAHPLAAIAGIRQFTLTNTSSTPQAIAFAPSRNFPFAEAPVCATLAPGASCTFSVAFVPETAGPLTGSVILTSTPGNGASPTQTVLYLQGFGLSSGALTFSDATQPLAPLDFGSVASGVSLTKTITVINTGVTPVTLRHLSSTAPFAATTTCATALAPGSACAIEVTYAALNQLPSTATEAPRTDAGTLFVEADAAGSPVTLYLTGTAIATPGSSPQPALPTYTLSTSALTFPDTQPGRQSPAEVVTVTNNGSVPVSFTGLQAPTDFPLQSTCAVLQPGATCTLTVSFSPAQNTAAPSLGTVTIVANGADAVDFLSLLGSSYPTHLQLSPASLDFGPVPLGSSLTLSDTITNATTLPITLGGLIATGDFSVDPGSCSGVNTPLAAGQACTFNVTFTPTAAGARTGSVNLQTPQSPNAETVLLTGVGLAGHLQLNPSAVAFGAIPLTTSAAQILTLGNSGTAPVTSLAFTLSGPNAADFSLSSGCPSTFLAVGAGCTLQVVFAPSAAGPRSATLSLRSTDPASPLLVPLSGTGSQPPGFALTVNGTNSGAATVISGGSANFALVLTPTGGYNGMVALTCKPLAPAPNATCLLANTQIGPLGGPANSSATVATLSGISSGWIAPFGLLSCGRLAARSRRKRRSKPRRTALFATACRLLAAAVSFTGCGGVSGFKMNPYTPPGAYGYQVTATSMSGATLSSSVILSVTVQ